MGIRLIRKSSVGGTLVSWNDKTTCGLDQLTGIFHIFYGVKNTYSGRWLCKEPLPAVVVSERSSDRRVGSSRRSASDRDEQASTFALWGTAGW